MSQTIKIDQLADTVMKGMEEYAKLAADDLKKDVKKAGDTVKKQIEGTAPKKTGKYSKSWAVKKTRETSDSIQVVVHSKRYQLTHLSGGHRAADKGYRKGFTERRVTMTHEEVMQMLAELKIPFAYDHFAEGESPDPPFICFFWNKSEVWIESEKLYEVLYQMTV